MVTIGGEGITTETRSFKTFTSSLTELKEWLIEKGVTDVAMESTGVYWKPVMNVLEGPELRVWIVNARHIKYVPGHKTDKKDSAWICQLLLAGLLKKSYVPPREQRELRDLTRYRKKLIQSIASEKNRIIRILEACNGKIGEHHKYMLQMIRKDIEQTQRLIDELTFRIAVVLAPYNSALEALSEIPGIDRKTAEDIVAEIGLDMEQFPTEKNLASWAGICPGNNESAGKKKLKDQPREQVSQVHHHGSGLGGDENERNISCMTM